VKLIQQTDYPWDGNVTVRVEPETPMTFTLRLRLPAWASAHRLSVNGQAAPADIVNGWLTLRRQWRAGDEVALDLPMNVARVTMPLEFEEYENLAAIERGPIVYCLEEQDVAFEENAIPKFMEGEPRSLATFYNQRTPPLAPSTAATFWAVQRF
jgi:DUF1680 family protein